MLVNKEISAVEITKDVLSRMEVTDDKVKAYITKQLIMLYNKQKMLMLISLAEQKSLF